ncbi:MAG: hypothetical protein KAS32_20885 [Candidatus Peribacteraceae bacterium]|nr:hypothetical protein [Candidatus Peribacteraceae bacterium]
MSKKVTRIPITINENQRRNMKDSADSLLQPKGRVRIFEKNKETGEIKLVRDQSNLIVYRGRSWLLQRAFNQDIPVAARADWKDFFISWFAVGTGGVESGAPLTPTSPALGDCALGTHGTIDDGGNFIAAPDAREFRAFDVGYPKFVNDSDVNSDDLCAVCNYTDPVDTQSYPCDKFIISVTKVTLGADEANGGVSPGDYQDISEAGLFVSPSTSLAYPFQDEELEMFARVTFSTIRKDDTRELIFTWYIYF